MNLITDLKSTIIAISIIINLSLLLYIVTHKLVFSAFFKKVWEFLTPYLQGGTKESAIRLAFLFVTFVSNISFWGVWALITLADNWQVIYDPSLKIAMCTPPSEVVYAYLGANGVAIAGKVGQAATVK